MANTQFITSLLKTLKVTELEGVPCIELSPFLIKNRVITPRIFDFKVIETLSHDPDFALVTVKGIDDEHGVTKYFSLEDLKGNINTIKHLLNTEMGEYGWSDSFCRVLRAEARSTFYLTEGRRPCDYTLCYGDPEQENNPSVQIGYYSEKMWSIDNVEFTLSTFEALILRTLSTSLKDVKDIDTHPLMKYGNKLLNLLHLIKTLPNRHMKRTTTMTKYPKLDQMEQYLIYKMQRIQFTDLVTGGYRSFLITAMRFKEYIHVAIHRNEIISLLRQKSGQPSAPPLNLEED